MHVWVCAGLELQELALEGGEVDCEGCGGRWAVWEGLGKECVVGLWCGGLRLGCGCGVEGLFAGVWGGGGGLEASLG